MIVVCPNCNKKFNIDEKLKDRDGVIDPDIIENYAKNERGKVDKEIEKTEKDTKTEKKFQELEKSVEDWKRDPSKPFEWGNFWKGNWKMTKPLDIIS